MQRILSIIQCSHLRMLFLVSASQSHNTFSTSTCDRSRAKGTDRTLPCGERSKKVALSLSEDRLVSGSYQCREGLDSAHRSHCTAVYPKLHLELLLSTESSTRPSLSCA